MASRIVADAVAKYIEAQGSKSDQDKFYPKPNRALIRRLRFGGRKELLSGLNGQPPALMRPDRSRIQRGISRPAVRGKVLTDGLTPVFVDDAGVVVDMDQFYRAAA